MGVGVIWRAMDMSKCEDIARYLGNLVENMPDITRWSGSYPARLRMDERGGQAGCSVLPRFWLPLLFF